MVVDRGEHGYSVGFTAIQPNSQQSAMYCGFWHLSILTSINFYSNLHYSRCSVGSESSVDGLSVTPHAHQ